MVPLQDSAMNLSGESDIAKDLRAATASEAAVAAAQAASVAFKNYSIDSILGLTRSAGPASMSAAALRSNSGKLMK